MTEFPVRDTHPRSEDQLLLQDLEEDPNFWSKMAEDDRSDAEEKGGEEAGSHSQSNFGELRLDKSVILILDLKSKQRKETP